MSAATTAVERIGGCAGAESDESVDLDRVEVGHRDVEAGFEQVPRHRRAHVAEADERQLEFRHSQSTNPSTSTRSRAWWNSVARP